MNPVVVILVIQAGAGDAAQLVDASKEGQLARDETDLRLEAKWHDGGDRGSHGPDGSFDTRVEERET